MNVLITGGAGFIGSHIADRFLKAGYKVKVLDNLSAGKKENLPNVKFVKGDIRNLKLLLKEFKGIDYVIHNAALISVPESIEKPSLYNDVNVNGTLNVLIAAQKNKVKKVVLASSAAVYGNAKVPIKENTKLDPLSGYALNKIIGEQYFQLFNKYGLKTVVLRYFNVFGPRQNLKSAYAAAIPIFINKLLSGSKATIFGDGKQTRDFIYVKDVAEANLLAVKKKSADGKILNIASGRKISINQLVKKISNKLQSKHTKERPGDIKHSLASVKESKKILGNYQKHTLEKGLKETVEFYKRK